MNIVIVSNGPGLKDVVQKFGHSSEWIPKAINNHSINSLLDVSNAFLKPKNKFHVIEFLPGSERINVVLPIENLEESNHRIKKNFRIPKLYSL